MSLSQGSEIPNMEPRRWTLQVCPRCTHVVFDEDHVRDEHDETLGGPCEDCLYEPDSDGLVYEQRMDVIDVIPAEMLADAVKAVGQGRIGYAPYPCYPDAMPSVERVDRWRAALGWPTRLWTALVVCSGRRP